jgi:uncharacterized protein (UPF0147 family)
MDKPEIDSIIALVLEISEDPSTPKNVKEKMNEISVILQQNVDVPMKIHKALNELDDIVNDSNIQQYTRTQIWNVVSLLEKM